MGGNSPRRLKLNGTDLEAGSGRPTSIIAVSTCLSPSIIAGMLGSVLGVIIGITAALAIARYMSAVMETAGGVAQRVTELQIDPALMAAGILIGVATSIFAAWIPARDAVAIPVTKNG